MSNEVYMAKAREAISAGNYDYAIDMYFEALKIDCSCMEAHQGIREASLRRSLEAPTKHWWQRLFD